MCRDGGSGLDKKKRYCILYIQDSEQHKLINLIEKYMSKEHGEVFYPCMEYYRRDAKAVKVKPIFPGYVFLYTDFNIKEVHNMIREHRAEISSGMRELRLSEQWMSDKNFLFADNEGTGLFDLSDVSEEEEKFLDYLREGNGLLQS